MTTQITVRKIVPAEAILITTPEDEDAVRTWLAELIGDPQVAQETDLTDLIDAHVWFLRDHGSTIVYIVPAADFITNYEEVNEDDPDNEELDFRFKL